MLTLGLIFLGTGYYLYNKNQDPEVLFQIVKSFTTDIVKKTVATGSVVPRKEIEIKPQVSGLISRLYPEPGDRGTKGNLIASIRIIPDMVTFNNAQNRVRRAKLSLENAEREYLHNKKLFEDGVISEAS